MAIFTVTVDWGERSEQLRRLHADLKSVRSFMLAEAPLPVAVGAVEPAQAGQWDSVTPTSLTVTPVAGVSKATVAIPDTVKLIRLDFELRVSLGGNTATCLAFRQLFGVGDGGALLPQQYSFAQVEVTPGTSGPPHAPTVASTARRSFLGSSPVVDVRPGTVAVNCEFLDVTELWWATWAGQDRFGWYLNPAFGGRPERLRVLAWTSGAAPMLWFVSVSDKAVGGNAETRPAAEAGASTPASRPGADIVFFRAPAGFNSFPYSATKEGFLTSHPAKPERVHGITTMFHLARWLLRPQPPTVIAAEVARVKTAGGLPVLPELMGMRLVPKTSPPPRIDPPEPLDMVAEDVRWAFRPVGVEEALRHAPAEDIAVLPLGFDGFGELPRGGYAALAKPDSLAPVLRSIWSLLWMRGAVHIKDTTTPARNSEIWLLGNSGANISMSNCLTKNAASVDRFISCDATPAEATKTEAGNLVPAVIPAIKRATEVRKGLSKTLEVFMITTPNMWNSKAAYEHRKAQIKDSKASVSYLPADAEWDDYWKYPPTATSNPLLFEVLSNWDGHGLDKSHQFGTAHGRQFLFWHEWSVDGGHLELVPNPPPAPPTPRVRSWLEQILQM